MFQENNITNLIDIQDVIINKVEMGENNVHIYFQLERKVVRGFEPHHLLH